MTITFFYNRIKHYFERRFRKYLKVEDTSYLVSDGACADSTKYLKLFFWFNLYANRLFEA